MSDYKDYGYKQVIVIRKDLNMRKGKMVAQGSHASMGAILSLQVASDNPNEMVLKLDERSHAWLKGNFKKITVSVNSEAELLELHQKAVQLGLINCLIKDSGLTEFNGVPTLTALAIGPDKDSVINEVTGHLPLL